MSLQIDPKQMPHGRLVVGVFDDFRNDPLHQLGLRLVVSMVARNHDGTPARVARCVDMIFQEAVEGQAWPEAAMPWLSYDAAQQLMDGLWRCGIRPAEGAGSAGQRAALEKHLEDMRAIVSAKLKVKL